jgi:hypothetical protein
MTIQRQMTRLLATSVAVGAMLTMMPAAAVAADVVDTSQPAPARWQVSVEGGYSSWNPLDLWWAVQDEAILGTVCDPTSSGCESQGLDALKLHGWSGAVELDYRPENSGYDLLIRGRYDVTNSKDIAQTFGFYSDGASQPDGGTATYQETHTGLDFEVGHDVGIGGIGNVRLFAGARYARFHGQSSFSTYQYESDWNSDGGTRADQHAVGEINRTFTGIGPRIGFNGSLPISGIFGLDYAASGALLFGDRATTVSFSTYELQGVKPEGSSKLVMVPNLEASAALTVRPFDNTKLSLGYRIDAYYGVMDTGLPGVEDGPNKQNRVIQGPFAKLTMDF